MLLLYIAVPVRQVRRWLLISASLLFYAWGNIWHLPLLIAAALVNFTLALLMNKKEGGGRRALLVTALVFDTALLTVFKYTGFIASSFNSIFGAAITPPDIASPLGISFFSFQMMSCIIDVYRRDAEPTRSFPKYLLYVSFFARVAQGPIIRWNEIDKELDAPAFSFENAAEGIRVFIIGLAMKLVLADTLAGVTDFVWALDVQKLNALYAWSGAAAFTLQIYFDFAGYSLMAVGLGRAFGFTMPANFNYPYASVSMTGFWRRWHITLSSWFRDYVYIPLGGSRKGFLRTGLNKIIVFLLTGLWHGPNLTFLVWGAYNGVLLLAESLLKRTKLRLPKPVSPAATLLAVTVGFTIFRSPDMGHALSMISSMFTGFSIGAETVAELSYLFRPIVLVVLIVSIPAATPIPAKLLSKLQTKLKNRPALFNALRYSAAAALLVLSLFFLASGSYHPSIYARF